MIGYAIAYGAGALTVVVLGFAWVRAVNAASDHITRDDIQGE